MCVCIGMCKCVRARVCLVCVRVSVAKGCACFVCVYVCVRECM